MKPKIKSILLISIMIFLFSNLAFSYSIKILGKEGRPEYKKLGRGRKKYIKNSMLLKKYDKILLSNSSRLRIRYKGRVYFIKGPLNITVNSLVKCLLKNRNCFSGHEHRLVSAYLGKKQDFSLVRHLGVRRSGNYGEKLVLKLKLTKLQKYLRDKDYDNFIKLAEKKIKKNKDKKKIVGILCDLGIVYLQRYELIKSEKYLKLAYKLTGVESNKIGIYQNSLINLGLLYTFMGKYKESNKYLYEFIREFRDSPKANQVIFNIGLNQIKIKNK